MRLLLTRARARTLLGGRAPPARRALAFRKFFRQTSRNDPSSVGVLLGIAAWLSQAITTIRDCFLLFFVVSKISGSSISTPSAWTANRRVVLLLVDDWLCCVLQPETRQRPGPQTPKNATARRRVVGRCRRRAAPAASRARSPVVPAACAQRF